MELIRKGKRMKKKYINAIIFCISLALGFLAISLYNTSKNILDDDVVTEKKIDLLREELDKADAEKRTLNDNISALKEEIRDLEELFGKNEKNFEELTKELNSYKVLSGGFDVSGPGIIININESSNTEGGYFEGGSIVYNYESILSVVSYLNSAGAEAISINDQRYTSYTEIVPVNDYLNINGKHVVAPIEIKAIGDKRTLNSAVNFLGGVIEQMKYMGFEVEVIENDDIKINGLAKTKEFKYAVPFEAEKIE